MLPTQIPGTIWFNAGNPDGAVTASIGQLLINTVDDSLWYKDDTDSSSWTQIVSASPPPPGLSPATRSEELQEFINAAGVNFVIDVAPASGIITSSPGTRTVGIASISPSANNSGISINTTSAF